MPVENDGVIPSSNTVAHRTRVTALAFPAENIPVKTCCNYTQCSSLRTAKYLHKSVPQFKLKSAFCNFNLMHIAHPNDLNHLFDRIATT